MKTRRVDLAEYLETDEDIREFLKEASVTCTPKKFIYTLHSTFLITPTQIGVVFYLYNKLWIPAFVLSTVEAFAGMTIFPYNGWFGKFPTNI